MPEPRKGEEKDAFVARCIRYLRREGMSDTKAILGKCYGIWKSKRGDRK